MHKPLSDEDSAILDPEQNPIMRFRSILDEKSKLGIVCVKFDLKPRPVEEWVYLRRYDDRGWNVLLP